MSYIISEFGYTTLDDEILQQCVILFNEHYGIWGSRGKAPGEHVRMTISKLRREYFFDTTCHLIAVFDKSRCILGYGIYIRFPWSNGDAVWITQLVVHGDYRKRGISKRIFCKCWSPDCIAWGLATSNPYAVKSLESITHKYCMPKLIASHAKSLIEASKIPYFQKSKFSINAHQSIIHSEFYLDHTNVNDVAMNDNYWALGKLEDGDEFLAFTFKDS